MLESLKSALNCIRPGRGWPDAPAHSASPKDTLAASRQARFSDAPRPSAKAPIPAPPDADRSGQRKKAAAREPLVPAGRVEFSVTPHKLALAQCVLQAMQYDEFLAYLLQRASCPRHLAADLSVQEAQVQALGACLTRVADSQVHDAAARDLCEAFSEPVLAKLAAFSRTEAGMMLLGVVPRLQLMLKYDPIADDHRVSRAPLCEDDQAALLACLNTCDPELGDTLAQLPPAAMRHPWAAAFTPDCIIDMAAFLASETGRAFVRYRACGCWLGMPNALVSDRRVWLRSMQSDMATLLGVPPQAVNLPVYVPSHVVIETLF